MSCCASAAVLKTAPAPKQGVAVKIGGITVALRTSNEEFCGLLRQRYGHFVEQQATPDFEFDLELSQPFADERLDDDVQVWSDSDTWYFQRGDFYAELDARARRGRMLHLPNPYCVDAVLRILHTLILARSGGFLLHASSAIRQGRGFLFSGISGAGKTTIASLAPPDVTLLTDEVSYVCRENGAYRAYGTPFAGELATLGANQVAPIAALYLLEKAPHNRIEAVSPADAIRALLRNTLFFAHDPALVDQLFKSACQFVERVPVSRLAFVPDARVWEFIH